MSEYIVTVAKSTLTRYNEIRPPPTPGLNQFWTSACTRMHTHMNDTAFLLCPDFKKRKKKDRPTDPHDFQAKRANKPLIF